MYRAYGVYRAWGLDSASKQLKGIVKIPACRSLPGYGHGLNFSRGFRRVCQGGVVELVGFHTGFIRACSEFNEASIGFYKVFTRILQGLLL